MIGKLAAALARCLLLTAGLLAIAALLLTVIAWRLLTWPYRHHRPGMLEAGLGVIKALAALAATLNQQVVPTEGETTR